MQQMNWSYQELMNTPQDVIDLIIEKNIIDSKLKK